MKGEGEGEGEESSTAQTSYYQEMQCVINRRNKNLVCLRLSVKAIERAHRDFVPSMVKINPFGTEREKGFDIFPHW